MRLLSYYKENVEDQTYAIISGRFIPCILTNKNFIKLWIIDEESTDNLKYIIAEYYID
jgi:hypothetical protein